MKQILVGPKQVGNLRWVTNFQVVKSQPDSNPGPLATIIDALSDLHTFGYQVTLLAKLIVYTFMASHILLPCDIPEIYDYLIYHMAKYQN